jgi:RNA polymerase sigma-70 factor (ECF subfamily)
MSVSPRDLMVAESLTITEISRVSTSPSALEDEVMKLFDRFRNRLVRYAMVIGLSTHDSEEIVQEVFLSLFRHLQKGKSRRNLQGWMFRVAHNLALKQRYANYRSRENDRQPKVSFDLQQDSGPNPEEQLLSAQRHKRLQAVVIALPEQDQCCLRLRAEGLRYREIARVLGISLGAVSISLTRSLERLSRADRV